MKGNAMKPKTLQQAIVYFSDPARAFDYAVSLRWPDGKVRCPRCGTDKHSFISTRRIWQCKPCDKQFTVKVGTIFEDSPITLDKWMTAVWMIGNCKNGISSYELHRAIGVTQKSAWFMLHRIRLAMQDDPLLKLGGGGIAVEVDETFIGGKARNMHRRRKNQVQALAGRMGAKTVVLGILERGKEVRAKVIADRNKWAMQKAVRENVQKGSEVHSDEFAQAWRMDDDYEHKVINHLERYVDGKIHTNGMENFWSLLKRGLHGTYVSVEPFHLFRYVDEQAFRYNNRRDATDTDRFETAMGQVFGKRLTYAELTGKVSTTHN